jgi:competence protein ComEA
MAATAQEQLPDAPAKKTVATVCGACHDLETAVEMRHTKAGWKTVIEAMVQRGALAKDEEFEAIIEYLAKYFGAANVNIATAKELEDVLEIPAEQADGIVKYRAANGDFKDLESLKKVPGVDAKVLDERKDRITFK